MEAILLAGLPASSELKELGVGHVFLLTIGGRTLLELTCRALIEGGQCTTIFVRAPEDIPLPDLPEVKRLMPSDNLVHDLMCCAKDQLTSKHIFLGAADCPLITAEAIAGLHDFTKDADCKYVFPIVPQSAIEQRFPNMKRTYLSLTDGKFSGGNFLTFDRVWMLKQEDHIRYMFNNRKNVLALVARFGLVFLFKILTKTASIEYLERHVGGVVGGTIKAVQLPFAEIASDLDKLSDLEFFREYLDPITKPG